MFKSIRTQLLFSYIAMSIAPLLIIVAVLVPRNMVAREDDALALQQVLAQRVAVQVDNFVSTITDEMAFLSKVQNLTAMDEAEQEVALEHLLTHNDAFRSLTLLDRNAEELAYVSLDGVVSPMNGEAWDRSDPIYAQPLLTLDTHYGDAQLDEESGKPTMLISHPLIDPETGWGTGVLVAEVDFSTIWSFLSEVPVQEGISIYVVDVRDRVIAHMDKDVVLEGMTFTPPEEDGRYAGLFGEPSFVSTADMKLKFRAFNVVVESLSALTQQETVMAALLLAGVIVLIIVVAVVVSIFVVNRITEPITALEETAVKIQDGDFAAQAPLDGPKEISTLAVAMNEMTAHIQVLIDDLEQRVVARTQALESSIEVSRRLSTILTQEELVKEVVEQIQETFGYYHVHIYLLDKSGDMLMLAGGTGDAGRVMLAQGRAIALGAGMVGRVAETNTPIVAADVTEDENWFHNPLLPETKSEAAVPISVGDVLLGVLDVQQDAAGSIRDEDIRVLQSIANQVAIALRNARLYADTREMADQQARINEINQKIQQATTVERALQIAVREVGRSVGSGQATVQLADFGITKPDDADMFNGNGHVSLEDAE